mgnify:CR=1 FL=1
MEAREIIEGLERAIVLMDAALELRLCEVEQADGRVVALFDPFERVVDDVPDPRLATELRRRLREVEEGLEDLRHRVREVADSSLYDPLRALRTDIALEGDVGTSPQTPPLVVYAQRQSRPDGWTFVLGELSVVAFGFTHEEALADLVAKVRSAIPDVLAEPPDPERRRPLAHRLQLAELQGRLDDVLTKALVLDDERAERLLREHGDEPDDRA